MAWPSSNCSNSSDCSNRLSQHLSLFLRRVRERLKLSIMLGIEKTQIVRLRWTDRAMLSNTRTSIVLRAQRHAVRCALHAALDGALRPKSAVWPKVAKQFAIYPLISVATREYITVFIASRIVFITTNTCSEFDARTIFLPSAATSSRSRFIPTEALLRLFYRLRKG